MCCSANARHSGCIGTGEVGLRLRPPGTKGHGRPLRYILRGNQSRRRRRTVRRTGEEPLVRGGHEQPHVLDYGRPGQHEPDFRRHAEQRAAAGTAAGHHGGRRRRAQRGLLGHEHRQGAHLHAQPLAPGRNGIPGDADRRTAERRRSRLGAGLNRSGCHTRVATTDDHHHGHGVRRARAAGLEGLGCGYALPGCGESLPPNL